MEFLKLAGLFLLPTLGVPNPSLHHQMRDQKKAVAELTHRIDALEKTLGRKNRKYMRIIKRRKAIEGKLFELRSSLGKQAGRNRQAMGEARALLRRLLISRIEDSAGSADLLIHKVLKDNLAEKLTRLKKRQARNGRLQAEIKALLARLEEYSQLENQLASLIGFMEKEKSSQAHLYRERKKSYAELSQKNRGMRPPPDLGRFGAPLSSHRRLEYGQKGVTYVYKKRQPVLATRSGRIIHSGALSTFGHVVIIDHGKETRSILLGPFESRVRKGMLVQEGHTLGHTIGQEQTPGRFYFEVRRKNKVQKTIRLLRDRTVARKTS